MPEFQSATAARVGVLEKVLALRPQLILPGARYLDRFAACLGATIGIGGTVILSVLLGVEAADLPVLVAPIGASAVLLFAVPASPLAQPWPVVGGNLVSAIVGILVASQVQHPAVAAGAAVALAILAMTLLRCLHPPGGGTALLPVLAGPQLPDASLVFALAPTLHAVLLVGLGWLFHRVSGHSYPHRAGAGLQAMADASASFSRFRAEDIDSALEELGETLDVSRDDLEVLFALAERHASKRMMREQADRPARSAFNPKHFRGPLALWDKAARR